MLVHYPDPETVYGAEFLRHLPRSHQYLPYPKESRRITEERRNHPFLMVRCAEGRGADNADLSLMNSERLPFDYVDVEGNFPDKRLIHGATHMTTMGRFVGGIERKFVCRAVLEVANG